MLAAVLVSPLTPVGEARLAVPSPGSMFFEPVVLPLGALAVLAAVIAVSIWPAVRHARLLGQRSHLATPVATAAGRSAARAGLPAIEQITLGDFVEINVNGSHVRTVAVTPLRGPALLSAVDGRLPGGDRDIMLGAATMRATKARLGGTVRVTTTDPDRNAARG
jgi:hypothetical protein